MRVRSLATLAFVVGAIALAPQAGSAPALLQPSSEHCCREKELGPQTLGARSDALTCEEQRVVSWLVQQIVRSESSPEDVEFTEAEIREALAVDVARLNRERLMQAVRAELVRISCARSKPGQAKTAS